MVKYRIGCYEKNISKRIVEMIFRHCMFTCRGYWSQSVSKSDINEGKAYGFSSRGNNKILLKNETNLQKVGSSHQRDTRTKEN